jgi:hypothetical protein
MSAIGTAKFTMFYLSWHINITNRRLQFNVDISLSAQQLIALHGCETWSLTLREEQRRRWSENKVLRQILRPVREGGGFLQGSGGGCITTGGTAGL